MKTEDIKKRCIKIDGKIYPRDTQNFDFNITCHDCGIENKVGNLHIFGCDMERCPKCSNQLISCGCKKTHIGINNNWQEIEPTNILK